MGSITVARHNSQNNNGQRHNGQNNKSQNFPQAIQDKTPQRSVRGLQDANILVSSMLCVHITGYC